MILFFTLAVIQEPFSGDEVRFFLVNVFFNNNVAILKEHSKVTKTIFESLNYS